VSILERFRERRARRLREGREASRDPALTGCMIKGFGVAFAAFGILFAYQGCRTVSWPSVSGRVVSTRIDEALGSKGSTTYRPVITYRYVVDGVEHTSDRLSGAVITHGRSWAQGRCDAYPVGSEVTVYYNPRDPAKAVLESGMQWSSLLFVAIGAGLFAAGHASTRRKQREWEEKVARIRSRHDD